MKAFIFEQLYAADFTNELNVLKNNITVIQDTGTQSKTFYIIRQYIVKIMNEKNVLNTRILFNNYYLLYYSKN